ncbi:hypothetical protein HYX03_01975 [Candidatus Woesearchaeota archaeon]|nr:hypothetical protein [Candidatus Woesearchaeota archaeon]
MSISSIVDSCESISGLVAKLPQGELSFLRERKEILELKDEREQPIYNVDSFAILQRGNPEYFEKTPYWSYAQLICYALTTNTSKREEIIYAMRKKKKRQINAFIVEVTHRAPGIMQQRAEERRKARIYNNENKPVTPAFIASRLGLSVEEVVELADNSGTSIRKGARIEISLGPYIAYLATRGYDIGKLQHYYDNTTRTPGSHNRTPVGRNHK